MSNNQKALELVERVQECIGVMTGGERKTLPKWYDYADAHSELKILKALLSEEGKEDSTASRTASPQIKLEDFHIGFEYEELIPDTERYLPSGVIWQKRVYCLNSPKLHKIEKYIKEGKVRMIWPEQEQKGEG